MSNKDMLMSDQALGALMMALQKSLMEQSDIIPVLKGLKKKSASLRNMKFRHYFILIPITLPA